MRNLFNFDNLEGYDLYHVRSVRGAIVVAINRSNEKDNMQAAQLFISKEQQMPSFTRS